MRLNSRDFIIPSSCSLGTFTPWRYTNSRSRTRGVSGHVCLAWKRHWLHRCYARYFRDNHCLSDVPKSDPNDDKNNSRQVSISLWEIFTCNNYSISISWAVPPPRSHNYKQCLVGVVYLLVFVFSFSVTLDALNCVHLCVFRDVSGFSEMPYAVALSNAAIWMCYAVSTPGRLAALVWNMIGLMLEVQ